MIKKIKIRKYYLYILISTLLVQIFFKNINFQDRILNLNIVTVLSSILNKDDITNEDS